jgi:hypothetical protein
MSNSGGSDRGVGGFFSPRSSGLYRMMPICSSGPNANLEHFRAGIALIQ